MTARERRQRAITALVFLVAAVTLVQSWFACVAAAAEGGRPLPWLWPTTLEAFAITLILVAWDSQVEGRPARLARLLLFLTAAVMAAVQVLDAPETPLGFITAAWTAVGLNLMVEVGVRLRYDAERDARRTTVADRGEVTTGDRETVAEPPGAGLLEPRREVTETPTVADRGNRGEVTTPTVGTVVTLTDADVQALRRVKDDPAGVSRCVNRRGLDRGEVDAQLGAWAKRNGHRERQGATP